ncbi:rab6, partial [Symbiodinium sp. CCMP2456]
MSLPKYKVVLVGDQSVGKTAVVVRYLKNTFEEKAEATIGMDFQTKTVQLLSGSQIRLQLWDTAGQERFRSLVNGYIRDAAAAVVCYDVTNRQSFDSTTQWIE